VTYLSFVPDSAAPLETREFPRRLAAKTLWYD
jgi:hypothetical protein